MRNRSLFVGNIPYDTKEEELRELFDEFGPIGEIRVISGKGFAFVDVPEEHISDAIAAINGTEIKGRALRVDEARPRSPSQGPTRSRRPTNSGGRRRTR